MPDRVAEALWYVGPGRAEIRREPVASPVGGEVQVGALLSGISRGTERLVLGGRIPPSEFEQMRGPFMAGQFPFPVKYGYAIVGRILEGPTELHGRLVFALHPHQSVFNVPVEAIIPVPDSVPPARAVLAANMETALNAVWDGAPAPVDQIAVVGAGVMGALTAWLCGQLPGTHVALIDVEPSRAEVARALGVKFALPDEAPRDCDIVFHASGSGAGLATALTLAGTEATVVELSWYGNDQVTIPLGAAFHSRRLNLISSQVGRVAPSHRSRWTSKRRLAAALDLLADARLDVLLAPAIVFHQLPMRLPDLLTNPGAALCPVISYIAPEETLSSRRRVCSSSRSETTS